MWINCLRKLLLCWLGFLDDDFRELVNKILLGVIFMFIFDLCYSGGFIDLLKE